MTIRQIALSVSTATVAMLSICAIAFAQAAKPVSVQIGLGSALSSTATHATGSTSVHAGLSLSLSDTTTLFMLPGTEGIDVDYNRSTGHGGHADVSGITYTNRISLIPKIAPKIAQQVVPYAGFGIGLFDDQVSKQETTTSDLGYVMRPAAAESVSNVSKSNTSLGGKLVAGVNISCGAFIEASYIVSGTSEGVRTDTVNLAVGMHL
jgi:hypothetical protein